MTTLQRRCRINSCLASARNNGLTVLDAIHTALDGHPWLLPTPAPSGGGGASTWAGPGSSWRPRRRGCAAPSMVDRRCGAVGAARQRVHRRLRGADRVAVAHATAFTVAVLMRSSWRAVVGMVERVVAEGPRHGRPARRGTQGRDRPFRCRRGCMRLPHVVIRRLRDLGPPPVCRPARDPGARARSTGDGPAVHCAPPN
jgi:hypothetical protein